MCTILVHIPGCQFERPAPRPQVRHAVLSLQLIVQIFVIVGLEESKNFFLFKRGTTFSFDPPLPIFVLKTTRSQDVRKFMLGGKKLKKIIAYKPSGCEPPP